jgi:hypothetical protein
MQLLSSLCKIQRLRNPYKNKYLCDRHNKKVISFMKKIHFIYDSRSYTLELSDRSK